MLVEAPVAYVENFEWNAIKYRADKNVKDIADGITQVLLLQGCCKLLDIIVGSIVD